MEQEAEKIFEPRKIIKIPTDIAEGWNRAGANLWENNGIPWLGNAYLWLADNPFLLEDTINEKFGINWEDYAEYHDGYTTECFGLCFEGEPGWPVVLTEHLELCGDIMEELGIEWCGWNDPAGFELIATEQQIAELERRLQEPIAEWKRQEAIHRYSF